MEMGKVTFSTLFESVVEKPISKKEEIFHGTFEGINNAMTKVRYILLLECFKVLLGENAENFC